MLISVFGQSAFLAETVFQRYQNILTREDIQEVVPAVLYTLKNPAFQSDPLIVELGGLDAALDLVLEDPDTLLTFLPDIDPYYITLFKTDDRIREFFRDPEVRALMKDPEAVEALARLLGIEFVEIPDAKLRAAIAEALGKAPRDAITRADMETLTELNAGGRKITDLRGIEFAINLTRLYLWFNDITDISPLTSLTNLERLNLGGNSISDISPLARLINLTELYLWGNTISDISPLSNLTNLTRLELWDNSISDISPLSSLINLTWLYIRDNNISDISPLSRLTNLTDLDIQINSISDISPLTNLINLTELYLGGNTISDISPLSRLTNLEILYLWDNSISDILPLAGLTNLKRLILDNNNISDVETLERLMAQGTVVYFRGNPAFEPPGPKIENGWVWLIVPATDVYSGSAAAASGRDFLSEASGGTVTEADVARNGARAGTRVGDSVWTAARLDPTDPNNLNIIAQGLEPDLAYSVDPDVVPIHSETPQEIGDSAWTAARLDATDIDKRNALMPDNNLETDYRYPVAYGVVPIHAETPQQTRLYIGAGPVKIWLNGTLVHKDIYNTYGFDYLTAVPVTLNTGNNLLFIAAYRPYPWTNNWGALFGFQDGTGYTVGAPGHDRLDVNADGQITVIDLAIVALFYGTQVPVGISLPADVNTDGIVNILDLTAVAQGIDTADGNAEGLALTEVEAALIAAVEQAAEIEAIAEAPNALSRGNLAYRNVAAAFTDAKHLATRDVHLEKAVLAVLEKLLQLLTEMRAIPEASALLPNYPNPFNPETWLPYQLATAAEVTLSIYSVDGRLVRTLDVGHQPAGIYRSKHRAAYWDGKNQYGEKVASGVYFYTLTAGEFTATRKLLIAK